MPAEVHLDPVRAEPRRDRRAAGPRYWHVQPVAVDDGGVAARVAGDGPEPLVDQLDGDLRVRSQAAHVEAHRRVARRLQRAAQRVRGRQRQQRLFAEDRERAEPVAFPGRQPHVAARPQLVPEQGAVAPVEHPLALHQRRRAAGCETGLLQRRDEQIVGHRLAVVQGVLAHEQPQVHGDEAAVAGRRAVPHAVHADDHVAAVPAAGAQVHLLGGVPVVHHLPRRQVVAPEAHGRCLRPVLEVAGGEADQLARPSPLRAVPAELVLPVDVVATAPLDQAGHLHRRADRG